MEHLQTQGISLPKLGLGTFRMQGDSCRAAVESALSLGYRHIDTAEMYANEEAIGAALAASGVRAQRSAYHDKGLAREPGAGRNPQGFDTSLKKLGSTRSTSISSIGRRRT